MSQFTRDPKKSFHENENIRAGILAQEAQAKALADQARASEKIARAQQEIANRESRTLSAQEDLHRSQQREFDASTRAHETATQNAIRALDEIEKTEKSRLEIERKKVEEILRIEQGKADRIVALENEKNQKLIQIEEEKKAEIIATERAKREHLEKEINEPYKFFQAQESTSSIRPALFDSHNSAKTLIESEPSETLFDTSEIFVRDYSSTHTALGRHLSLLLGIDIRYLKEIEHKRELKELIADAQNSLVRLKSEAVISAEKLTAIYELKLRSQMKLFTSESWMKWISIIEKRRCLEEAIIKNLWHGFVVVTIPLTLTGLVWRWHLSYPIPINLIILTGAFLFWLSYRLHKIKQLNDFKFIEDAESDFMKLLPTDIEADFRGWSVKTNKILNWVDQKPSINKESKEATRLEYINRLTPDPETENA